MTSINKVDIKFYAVHIRDYTISGYTPKTPAQYFWSRIESGLPAVLLRIYSEMTSEKGRARILARYRRNALVNAKTKLPFAERNAIYKDYRGKSFLLRNGETITSGKHQGKYICKTSANRVAIHWNGIATTDDELMSLRLNPNEPDEVGTFLASWAKNNSVQDARTGEWYIENALRRGYVGYYGRIGYFSGGLHCMSNHNWYMDEDVARLNGVDWSEFRDAWWELSHPGFAGDYGNGNAGYHHYARQTKQYPELFGIGVEIEKEDSAAVAIDHRRVNKNTGWYKERDGSLSDDYGYELVSPVYDLMSDKLFDDIENDKDLLTLVNGDYDTKRCGGHMHISKNGVDGDVLLDSIAGYLPLLYSIYRHRVNKNYSLAKSKLSLKRDKQKYQAIQIFDNRIEIRIFPAVKNLVNLKWRVRLVRHMVTTPCFTPKPLIEQLTDDSSTLCELLREVLPASRVKKLAAECEEWASKIEEVHFCADGRSYDEERNYAYADDEDEHYDGDAMDDDDY